MRKGSSNMRWQSYDMEDWIFPLGFSKHVLTSVLAPTTKIWEHAGINQIKADSARKIRKQRDLLS